MKNKLFRDTVFLFFITLFTLLVAGWAYNVKPQFILTTPLNTYGDGQLLEFLIQNQKFSLKSIFVTDFIGNIGWPGGTYFELYGQNDDFFYSIFNSLKNLFNINIASTFTTMIILKFIFSSIIFYCLLRFLGVKNFVAFIFSIFFSFIPYNFIKSEGHFMLGQTWIIPISLWFALTILIKPNFFNEKRSFFYFISIVSGVASGFSGTYYFLFTLIFTTLLFINEFFSLFKIRNIEKKFYHSKTIRNNFKLNFTKFLKTKFHFYILFYTTSIISFLITSYDSILAQKSILNILLIKDSRVIIESILYAGNLSTLFSDIYFYIDKVIGSSMQSTIGQFYSGEGIGIGPYFTGFSLIILIYIFSIKINEENVELKNYSTYIFTLTILLFFYLQGFFGFFIAEFWSTSLRAWGRISIFIATICLVYLSIFITEIIRLLKINWRDRLGLGSSLILVMVYLLTWNMFYIFDFNSYRPSRQQNLSVYNTEKTYNEEIYSILKNSLSPGCPIAILPIYKFPEFETPYDRLADYDLLGLPLTDEQKIFKWNIGNIKWADGDQYWSPLIVDIPPFASANFETQVAYANEYGACAIALNQRMFEKESDELPSTFLTNLECKLIFDERKQSPLQSWTIWDIRDNNCRKNLETLAALDPKSFPIGIDKPLLWRFTTISPEYFEKNLGVFSYRSDANVNFIGDSKQFKNSNPFLSIGVINGENNFKYDFQICIKEIVKNNNKDFCENILIKNSEKIKINLKKYLNSNKYNIFINPNKSIGEYNWTFQIIYEKK